MSQMIAIYFVVACFLYRNDRNGVSALENQDNYSSASKFHKNVEHIRSRLGLGSIPTESPTANIFSQSQQDEGFPIVSKILACSHSA